MINYQHLAMRSALNQHWRQQSFSSDLPPHFNSRLAAIQIHDALTIPESYTSAVATLRGLVANQYDPTRAWRGETSGRVSQNQYTLGFESFVSEKDKDVRECFDCFRRTGQQDAALVLSGQVRDYVDMIQRNVQHVVNYAHIEHLGNVLFEYGCAQEKPRSKEAIDFDLLKTVLQSVTQVKIHEYRPNEPDFRGTFHFHPDGTPANQVDVEQSFHLGVPVLVVAVQKEFPHVLNLDILTDAELFRSIDLRQSSYVDIHRPQHVQGPLKLVARDRAFADQ